jgi:hypothetical protein
MESLHETESRESLPGEFEEPEEFEPAPEEDFLRDTLEIGDDELFEE